MKRTTAVLCTLPILAGLLALAPTATASVAKPAAITSVTPLSGGSTPGSIALTWRSSGARTSYFRLETATTEFSPYPNSPLPRYGRNWAKFIISKAHLRNGVGHVQISQAQLSAAGSGAPLPSGNHLYFRLFAVNNPPGSGPTAWTAYPYEKIIRVRGQAPTGSTPIRVASYNVHVAHPSTDSGNLLWSRRGPRIAADIVSAHPGLVAIQEASAEPMHPNARLTGWAKVQDEQAAYLLRYVNNIRGGESYRLNRVSPYEWGANKGVQATRILYDSSRYRMLSNCTDQNSAGEYQSTSCAFRLYKRSVDPSALYRWASYAQFEDLSSHARFWVLSAHLDNRQAGTYAQRRGWEQLRRTQLQGAISTMKNLAHGQPIVIGMDQNTWQSIPTGFLAHYALVSAGFYDAAAAVTKVNYQYSTENHQYNTGRVQAPTSLGAGARLDVVAMYGMTGASTFRIWHHGDALVRSDHNMVTADVRLP